MKEAQNSSETSALTRVTQSNIPEEAILQGLYSSSNVFGLILLNGDEIERKCSNSGGGVLMHTNV
jgi:hypothetical protein